MTEEFLLFFDNWYGGKVQGVKWKGGAFVQLLNSDADLLHLQIQENQANIRIIADEKNRWIHIATVPFYVMKSKNSFIVYERIAKHIKEYINVTNNKS